MRSYVNTRPEQERSANRSSCQVSVSVKPCYRCGALHLQVNRPFKNSQWHFYGKTGHIAKLCKSKATKQKQTLIDSLTEDKASDEISSAYSFFSYSIGSHHSEYTVHLSIDGHDIPMETNIGSSFSVISHCFVQYLANENSTPI